MIGCLKKTCVALGLVGLTGPAVCCAALLFAMVAQVPPVTLMEPSDSESTYMMHPQFRWTEEASADRYEIQIAADSGFTSVQQSDSIPVPRYIPLEALPVGDYWWRVRVQFDDGSVGAWSEVRQVTVAGFQNTYTVSTNDSLSVITNTIASAAANTPSRLIFESGVYNLDLPNDMHLLDFSNVRNMEVEGNLCSINLRNPDSGFAYFDGCEDILLRRFNIDYMDYLSVEEEPVTYTAGTVVSVRADDASFVFEPLPGHLPPDDVRISNASSRRWGSLVNTNMPGCLKDNVRNWYDIQTQVDSLGGNQYRLYLTEAQASRITCFEEGDVFAKSASYADYVMYANKSSNLTYELITSYGGSGNHFIGHWNDGINFLRCASRIKEGRYVSNTCGGYVGASYLTGFWVEDCFIEGMLDDPFNCVNKPMVLYDKISTNIFRVYNLNPAPMLEVGQHLTVYTPATGNVEGPFEVTSVSIESAGAVAVWRVTVDGDIGDVVPGNGSYDTQFFINERNHPYAYVRNNTFQNSRGNCHFRSTGGVMESNNIVRLSDVALRMKYYIGGGWNVDNVRITGNYIEGCGYHSIIIAQDLAAIDLALATSPDTNSVEQIHQNLKITGNMIVRQRKGISVANTQNVLVTNNILVNVDESIVVDAESTSDIVVTGNSIIIDNDANTNTYSELSGTWFTSSLEGYAGTSTRYAGAGAVVQWSPDLPAAGTYDVYIYKVVHANSDPTAKITVHHANGDEVQYLDYSTGFSGWVFLGTYDFAAGTDGFVKNEQQLNNCRADAVWFLQIP